MVSDFYKYPDVYDALLPVGAHLSFYADCARQHSNGQRFPVMTVDTATFGQLVVEGTHDYDAAEQIDRGTGTSRRMTSAING